nr:L630 [uncultured bacterium]
MDDLTKSGIEEVCRELAKAFQGVLSWKWDKRFETVLAEFAVGDKDKIRAVLERHLSKTFDSSNVGNGPELVRAVDDHFGGLWPGQLLFASDPSPDALVYCTWWPWGDGKAISIRIGSEYKNLSDSDHAEKIQLFKGWFGV